MVERILSTAKLHRYLLEVPQPDDIEVRYNSTKWLAVISAMREMGAVEKYRIPKPQTLKGGIEIQLRSYVIAPYPTK